MNRRGVCHDVRARDDGPALAPMFDIREVRRDLENLDIAQIRLR
jgi:hypothetical protein